MKNINPQNILPAEKKLLIKIQEKATETSSGIIIAGNEQNTAPTVGEVLRCGKNSIYKEGDVVIFRRYSVDEIRYQDGDEEKVVYFIEDTDALGKVEVEKEIPSKEERRAAITEKKNANQNKTTTKKG